MHNFKELKVGQKSVDLAIRVYELTNSFPSEEKYGLVSQMRRASISIASNIAEGCAKTSSKSFSNSLEISFGESFELETQIIISQKVGVLSSHGATDLENNIVEIQRMIVGLKNSLNTIT
ncbi:four helix bundle protein [Algoriphagus namhaensis]